MRVSEDGSEQEVAEEAEMGMDLRTGALQSPKSVFRHPVSSSVASAPSCSTNLA